MNKKILYILLLLIPLMSFGQYNFSGPHSNNQVWYLFQVAPQYMATKSNFDISFSSDGTSMYVLGGNYSTHVYQYSLGAAWNTRSCTYYSACSVSNEESTPHAMFFKPDGTKLYVLGTNTDKIFQYTLSTAWLISSATYDEKYFYVGGSENIPTALFFKPDGSKVFFLGQQNKTVYVLSLLTSWDISTSNLKAEEYDFSSEEIYPHSLWFHDDGLIMYVQGIRKDKIYKYSLSTAWTLPGNGATVTLVDSFQISKDEAQGIYINPDELKLYTVGVGNVNTYYFNEPFSIPANVNLKNGLISCWEFDETSGTTAYDAHGDNDLTIAGGATINQTGKINKAYSYDGTNDQLNLASASDFEGLTGLTVSAWVYSSYTTTRDEYRIIVSKLHSSWESPYYQFQLRVRHGAYDRYEFVVGSSSTFGLVVSDNDTYLRDQWVHLLGYWHNNGTMKLYVNGTLVDDAPSASVTTATGSATSSFTIGDDDDAYSGNKNWSGIIDQVAIYNRVLNESEIKALYNSGNGKAYSTW